MCVGHRPAAKLLPALMLGAAVGCRTPSGPDPDVGGVGLSRVGGALELSAERRTRDQQSKTGGTDTYSEENLLFGAVGLDSDGYVYHPNLLAFSAGVLLGRLRNEFESEPPTSVDEGESGSVVEYDLRADFVREKEYPGTAFAHRYEGLEPRPFFTSVRRTTEEYGLRWSYLGSELPTRLLLNHSDVLYDPLGTEEDDRSYVNDLLRVESEHAFSDENKLALVYERESAERTPVPVVLDVDTTRLSHELIFGSRSQNRLDSMLTDYRQSGTDNVDRLQLSERLYLEHTDDLRSRYSLDLRNVEQDRSGGSIEELSGYLSGALQHQLYDSLVSEIGGYVEEQDFDGATDVDRIEGHIDLDYRRSNPWGELRVKARCLLNKVERSGSGSISIVDEPHTFVDPLPVILDAPGIDLSTIVITNLAGTEIYVEGADYTLFEFANRVEVRRVPTGLILNGQTVLIDYVIRNAGDSELETWGQHYGVRQVFPGGWATFYRLQIQDQALLSGGGIGSPDPEDIHAQTVGLEYRRGSFNALVEYVDYDSNITPYEAFRVDASYSHPFGPNARGGLGGSWVNTSYRAPNDRESEYFTVDASYRHALGQRTSLDCRVRYLDDEDTASNLDNEGVDVDLSLEWAYRSVDVRLVYESGFFENSFYTNDSSRIYVQVRRAF